MLRYFGNETVDATLIRYGAGSYSDADGGDWVEGATTETSIRIIVPQPVKSNELDPLPEGEKVSNYRRTYCAEKLRTREGGQDADRLEYPVGSGKRYKIFRVDERDVLGNFYRVIMREEI